MKTFHRLFIFLFSIFLRDVLCLKNVRLTIEPRVVRRQQHSILRCEYDLEAAPLYSVKWYRGPREFYRYTPTDLPHMKIFPLSGITVNLNSSNGSQVLLENIEFNVSGNFSCEVTTDTEPVLSIAQDTQTMLVVQLPDSPPTISVGHEPLDIGDTLRANCSSPPSRPPAILKFLLNNIAINRSEPMTWRKQQEYEWSDLMLKLPLSTYHFSQGRLVLSCVAQVTELYTANATLELESVRNPVPERVSAVNSVSSRSSYVLAQLIIFHLLNLISN